MAKKSTKTTTAKSVETLKHTEATRKNIPSAEHQSVMEEAQKNPVRVAYERRNRDLDPQLVWRGKDEQDWSDLVVQAPPLYIQEKIHPKVLIDDLRRQTEQQAASASGAQIDLFADFNGLPDTAAKTEFYQHDAHWSNRMILGDSLAVMASLAEREGLRGKVQCIYFDPPYGIKFNSNFQWSTTSRDVKDGNVDHITREPEQVKAFRDTWRDGIHSYLTYLRDRLTVARDLLTDSGSIFVQIGDENVHRVRALMEEIFGVDNHVQTIAFQKTAGATSSFLPSTFDHLVWFGKNRDSLKFRSILLEKSHQTQGADEYAYFLDASGDIRRMSKEDLSDAEKSSHSLRIQILTSQSGGATTRFSYEYSGKSFIPGSGGWKTSLTGMRRLDKSKRLHVRSTSLNYVRFLADFPASPLSNMWDDTAIAGWSEDKRYVVQTARRVVERCVLLTTDPGDLVLDPTCGSGTTAYVAEQWGRRWITIDTSRVALALARARIMGARYPFYLLADSPEGKLKEAELTRTAPSTTPTHGNIRHGFVYERVPHVTLKSIANNAEIDVIWEKWQQTLEPIRAELNALLGTKWEEWEIPRWFGFRTKRTEGSVGRVVDAPEAERIAKLLTGRYPASGDIKCRSRMLLLPSNASLKVRPRDARCGVIRLEGWGAAHARPTGDDIQYVCQRDGLHLDVDLSVKSGQRIPENVELMVTWLHTTNTVRVRVPFPSKGVRGIDGSGREMANGTQLAVQQVFGVRLVALNGSNPAHFALDISAKRGRLSRTYELRSLLGSVTLEVRLLDYISDINHLLSSDDLPDAAVYVVLRIDGDEGFKLSISRYAFTLNLSESAVALSPDAMRRIPQEDIAALPVLAARLQCPGEEANLLQLLENEEEETKICWDFSPETREPGSWLIFPAANASIPFRPTLWTVGDEPESFSPFTPLHCSILARL